MTSSRYTNSQLMRNSCHIRHLMKCPNWCRTWNICFLLIFSWKMLKPNFAFWDIFLQLRCLNSKGIKLQRSIRVICIIFDLIFFQLKIKNITNIPSSTTISTLCQASNMTWIAQKYILQTYHVGMFSHIQFFFKVLKALESLVSLIL